MKAQVIARTSNAEKFPLKIINADVPSLRDHEIEIEVSKCAVCRTDLHIVEGDLKPHRKRVIPGHQIVGRVVKIGKEVKGFRIGERVGITWINSVCGKCKFCKAGRENLCKSIKFTGYDVNGGYAQFAKVNSGFALKLPKTFDDEHAAPLLCAGIIGYRAFKLSGAGRGSKLAMFGFGGAANITIQVAKYMGCRVFVFTRNKAHKKSAKKLGAAWVGGPDSVPKEKYDAAIIFAPAGELVVKALKHLERGGKVIIADIHMSKIPEIDYNDLYFEKSIASVANYTRKDADEFLALAEKIQIITHVTEFGLEDANKALLELKESKINGSAVLNITNNK